MKRVLILAVCALATACAESGPSEIEAMQQMVAGEMRDPASARFREVRKVGDVYCGEANGANAFGGMTGFKRFIADDEDALFEEDVAERQFNQRWARLCG